MRSGDRPGLQNRRAAGHPVAGGFDPHSLPPFGLGSFRIRLNHEGHEGNLETRALDILRALRTQSLKIKISQTGYVRGFL